MSNFLHSLTVATPSILVIAMFGFIVTAVS